MAKEKYTLEQQRAIDIAETIMAQIVHFDRYSLMAWGATQFTALEESKEYQGGVIFRVNGLTHQGFVRVELKWIDVYVVSFLSLDNELVKEVEDVYCDQLVQVIDFIEGK